VAETGLSRCGFDPAVALAPSAEPALRIRNDDAVGHEPVLEPGAHVPMPLEGEHFAVSLAEHTPGVIIPISCALHPAEHGWVVVPKHPYYAITDDDGRFRFADVPTGSFLFHAWLPPLADGAGAVQADRAVELQLPADGQAARTAIQLELP
jgi:hypothetical protein